MKEIKDWTLEEKHKLLLLSEIGVMLHDLGKFSESFLGGTIPRGGIQSFAHDLTYDRDYGGERFLNETLQNVLSKERDILKKMTVGNRKPMRTLLDFAALHHPQKLPNPENRQQISYHHFPLSEDEATKKDSETEPFFPWLALLTMMADKADSAIDKAFPQENQASIDQIHIASPFGVMKKNLDTQDLEAHRKEFQVKLANLLKDVDDHYIEIRNKVEALIIDYWQDALGETRIPSNDVRLHEHSISTATIFKAELARRLIENDLELNWYDESKLRFQLIGVQWSWWDVTCRAFKVPDIIGRSLRLGQIKTNLKRLFQEGSLEDMSMPCLLPLGNAVYDDQNGIYFLIGSLAPENDQDPAGPISHLLDKTATLFEEHFAGEVKYQVMRLKSPTNSLTHLTHLLAVDEKHIEILSRGPSPEAVASLWADEKIQGREICQVCRLRPLEDLQEEVSIGSDTYTEVKKCGICKKIAGDARKETLKPLYKLETVEMNELRDSASGDSRVALVSVKLDISNWLNGHAFDSVYCNWAAVSETNILKARLKRAKQFEKIDFESITAEKPKEIVQKLIKIYNNNEKKVNRKLRSIFKISDDQINSYLAEHYEPFSDISIDTIFSDYPKESAPEDTDFYAQYLNYGYFLEPPLLANTKIQSEEDNVLEYYRLKNSENNGDQKKAKQILWNLIRRQLELCWQFAGFDGKPTDVNKLKTALTMKYPSPSRLFRIINEAREFTQEALDELNKMAEKGQFHFRHLVRSPIFLQVLMPASRARFYVEKIDALYRRYFGIVADRLPIHVRTVYFYYKTPLYIAMDAARRMFQNNALRLNRPVSFQIEQSIDQLKLVFDNLHRTSVDVDLKPAYPTYFANYRNQGTGKPQNIALLRGDETFDGLASTYDAVFLDTATRRYDLFYDHESARSHYMLGDRRQQIPLFPQVARYEEVMDFLGDNDSKIKNLQALLVEKHLSWNAVNNWRDEDIDEQLKGFFKDCLANLYGKKWHNSSIQDMILYFAINGNLFDIIEQKLFIEKQNALV